MKAVTRFMQKPRDEREREREKSDFASAKLYRIGERTIHFRASADLFAIHSRVRPSFRDPSSSRISPALTYETPLQLHSVPLFPVILIMPSRTFCQQYRETYQMHRLIPLSDLASRYGINVHLPRKTSSLSLKAFYLYLFQVQKSSWMKILGVVPCIPVHLGAIYQTFFFS